MDNQQTSTGHHQSASEPSMPEPHQTNKLSLSTQAPLVKLELRPSIMEGQSPTAVFHKYHDLPPELKIEVLSHLLVAPSPIVNMIAPSNLRRLRRGEHAEIHSSKPKSALFRRRPCFAASAYRNNTMVVESALSPSVLRANMECRTIGLYLLYGVNIYLIKRPSALLLFVRKYPEAAGRMQKLVLEAELEQVGAFYERILKTPTPHLSRCLGKPDFFISPAMTEQLASQYSSLESLTIDFQNWEQKQEFDPHAEASVTEEDCGQVGKSGSGENTALSRHLASMMNESSLSMMDADTLIPRYRARVAQPVRVVRGADLKAWVKRLVDGGWQARIPKVTGLETLADQGLVVELIELLKRG